ncbi:MAG: peroxiredoxin [Gallionella sp.]
MILKVLAALAALVIIAALLVARAARKGELPVIGQAAPDFNLPDQDNKLHKLADYRGHWLVLYFYPKDDTTDCTKEACAFRDDLEQITELGAKVVGVSIDDVESHAKFAKKYRLPFPLLADKTTETSDRYGTLLNLTFIKMDKRHTFLIDPQGIVEKRYLTINASRHSQQIIKDLKKMTKGSQS